MGWVCIVTEGTGIEKNIFCDARTGGIVVARGAWLESSSEWVRLREGVKRGWRGEEMKRRWKGRRWEGLTLEVDDVGPGNFVRSKNRIQAQPIAKNNPAPPAPRLHSENKRRDSLVKYTADRRAYCVI